MAAQTYELEELATLLNYSKAYIKMILKKQPGYRAGEPISEELAAIAADKVNRPWPPA